MTYEDQAEQAMRDVRDATQATEAYDAVVLSMPRNAPHQGVFCAVRDVAERHGFQLLMTPTKGDWFMREVQ